MALSNMQVFNEYVMPATLAMLDQQVAAFNAQSQGAIVLTSDGFVGDFATDSFFSTLAAARRRVDRYAANAAVAATPLVENKNNHVKIAGGFGPVVYEPSQFTWLQRPTQQGIAAIANDFAQLLLQDQLNTIVAAAVAALENNAAVVHDVSGAAPISQAALNGAYAKFGDSSSTIITNVMNGATMHRLIGDNLTNAERLFQSGSVMVIDIQGRRSVVTDAPALAEAGAPNKQKVLGLARAAAQVGGVSDLITNVETSNGKERIETTFQVDYTFTLGMKGYSWDDVNGGKSPADADIATGSNWDKSADYDKHTAGVIAIGQDV